MDELTELPDRCTHNAEWLQFIGVADCNSYMEAEFICIRCGTHIYKSTRRD